MNTEITDIQVYILSHDRPLLLAETLECFLNQTIQGFDITILDNSADNSISQAMLPYLDKGIEVIYADKDEQASNLQRAQLLCSKKWVIAFHDDDLVHPQYMEHVLETINNVENIDLIGTLTVLTDEPDNDKWGKIEAPELVVFDNVSEFAAAIFKGMHVPFCSTVYRTEFFKTVSIGKEYGKMGDRPFMYDCAKSGRVAVINEILVQSRTNSYGRDSNVKTTGPFKTEFFALLKKYKLLMGDSLLSKTGRTFLLRSTSFLLMNSPWEYNTPEKNVDKIKYIREAVSNGSISWKAFILGIPYYILYKLYKTIIKR